MKQKEKPPTNSYYHLWDETIDGKLCQGTACFVARHLDPARWQEASSQSPRVYCLGKCYAAPAASADEGRPRVEVHSREAIVLGRIAQGVARTLKEYTPKRGYRALQKVLNNPPEEIVKAIESSGLRGRGGAGFPTGRKWRAVFKQTSLEKYVIANADEGDPGAFIDRFIMEDDPHSLLEAMAVAAYAVGAQKGYIYLRKEYPQAFTSLHMALEEARKEGLLGEGILNTNFSFDIELVLGQGSYVCGEETALINSIEGKRPEVMPRPPYPTDRGLFRKPTLVNNVETLASVPWIVLNGAEAYRALGFSNSRGTKVISLNSLFRHPGLYEIEFGMTLRQIVEELGGGLKTGEVKGVIVGGPPAGIVPPHFLDTPLGFEELRAIGANVGHGGIVAFDEHTSLAELMHHVFAFGAYESCGKCTPCRLGSRSLEQTFHGVITVGTAPVEEKTDGLETIAALKQTSLCGLGIGLAEFAESAWRYYGKELEPCFA